MPKVKTEKKSRTHGEVQRQGLYKYKEYFIIILINKNVFLIFE